MGLDFQIIDTIGQRQHGLITTAQLRDVGATPSWISSQVRIGRLVRIRRGVYRLSGVPPSQDQAWLAAVLSAASECCVSHGSAAAAWGLDQFAPPTQIDLLSESWRPRIPGVRGHQTAWLPDRDLDRVRGIPVTTTSRTFVDASGLLDARSLGRSLDDALRRRLVHLPRLVACFDEVPASGRRPSRNLRDVLSERLPSFNPGGSEPELDVLRVLRNAGIRPLPIQQFRVTVGGQQYVLDHAWPETKHALEYMGALVHGTPSALHRDSTRTRRLIHAGWTVWPLTAATTENEIIAIGVTATRELAA